MKPSQLKEHAMRTPWPFRLREQRGQAIVLLVLTVAATLALAALLVDGGNAMAQQRATQNGTDAAAYAGASVLVEDMGGHARNDADVLAAVQATLAANSSVLRTAVYVNYDGLVVGTVGQGGPIPGNAYGVRVDAERTFDTHMARIVNMPTMETGAQATAMAGAIRGICPAADGCVMAPVTFSIPIQTCDGTNRPLRIGDQWPLVDLETALADTTGEHMSIVPLCRTGPGGVGWLDMGDVGCPGNNLAQWILTPCNQSFDIPIWLKTKPGNMNNVETAMNTHKGKVLLIPMFASTCREPPASGDPGNCTNPGQGNNLWYYIPQFAAFLLYEAYIQGNDGPACNSAPGKPEGGGNGSTSCFKGWFVQYITVGPVGPPMACEGEDCVEPMLGVQLVR